MNGKLKGQLLLEQTNFDSRDHSLVVGTEGGDYSFQSLATSLRNAFRLEGLSTASKSTISVASRQRKVASIHVFHDSQPAGGLQGRSNSSSSSPARPMLYTNMNSDKIDKNSFAIVNFGSCCSALEKATLDKAMQNLEIDRLKGEPICQRKYLCRHPNRPVPAVCAVHTSFKCKTGMECLTVEFRV